MRIFAQAVTTVGRYDVPVPPKGDNTWQLVAVVPSNFEFWDANRICYWQREQDVAQDKGYR